jgi:hypothetical protein
MEQTTINLASAADMDMRLLAVQDEKITCEVSEFLDSRERMPSTSQKPAIIMPPF